MAHFFKQYPNGRSLLLAAGLSDHMIPPEGDPLAAYLTLGSLLQQHGLDATAFSTLLADQPNAAGTAPRRLWIEADLPCALKAPLEIAMEQAGKALLETGGAQPDITVQSENETAITRQGASITSLDRLPDLTVAAGYNTLLDQAFMGRFANTDNFEDHRRTEVNARLKPYAFADPLGIYRVIGVNVFVFVVDPSQAKGRRAPESWEDLLGREYAHDVAVCGMGDKVSGSLMLHLQARFGDAAVRALSRNVRAGMHPSQVIKKLGTGLPESPAVAVMPHFFARLADIRRPTTVVWPKDGAVAMPFFQLVKRLDHEGLRRFAAHLEGPEVGAICSGAAFPSLHPDIPCPLPDEARLSWLGWDYIRANDLAALRDRATALFEAARDEIRS